MDDLLGEDWKASPQQSILQASNRATFASGSSSLVATSQKSSSAASSFLDVSRPSSTRPVNRTKVPLVPPKATIDAFGGLTGLKAQNNGTGLSIQERQRQLAEEKQRHLQEQGRLWDSLGDTSSRKGTSVQEAEENVEDILAAFNKDAKVDKSSHFPAPSLPASEPVSGRGTPANELQQHSYEEFEDDDTFGLSGLAKSSNGHAISTLRSTAEDDDDILGDLSRPVAPKPAVSAQISTAKSPDEGWDENVARQRTVEEKQFQDPSLSELTEMGFPEDTAKIALAENGGDVQRSVGWLLQQAHEESKQKAKEPQTPGRQSPRRGGRSPPRRDRDVEAVPSWMKQESRSGSQSRQQQSQAAGEKDAAKIAQEYGSKFLKSANSLWKASQKQMAKTVAEFQQDRDTAQPKWMQSGSSSRDSSQPRLPRDGHSAQAQAQARATNLTDEAALLDMPREGPPIRTLKQPLPARTEQSDSRDRSPSVHQLRKDSQVSARSSPQPFNDRRPASKLSRQEVEEQSAQAYVSPARRKQAKPKPEVIQPAESEVDLFSLAPTRPAGHVATVLQSSAARPTPSPSPHAPPRTIPPTSAIALSTSADHRKRGSEAFKRGDYGSAHESYTAALQPLPPTHPLVIVVLSNRSLTALKTGDARTAVSDAGRALEIIGSGLGAGESIDLGGSEGQKEMREFYGKALMRKAEALEHMEKWTEAANVWRLAVEGGVGGVISLRGKDRCERAAAPPKVPVQPERSTRAVPVKQAGNNVSRRSANTSSSSEAAVRKLREANAAAERADDEKFQLADKVDAQLIAWKGSKADNLRALLQSLDAVLWEGAGWKKVGMSDLVMPNKVKIIYMKAIAKVHPDKIGQDASTEQRMISGAVFSTLNEAWDKFKKDNNL